MRQDAQWRRKWLLESDWRVGLGGGFSWWVVLRASPKAGVMKSEMNRRTRNARPPPPSDSEGKSHNRAEQVKGDEHPGILICTVDEKRSGRGGGEIGNVAFLKFLVSGLPFGSFAFRLIRSFFFG